MITVNDIRKSFLDYFVDKGHSHVPSSSLIPHNDPTLMFTNSGMVQFKNYFTGVETPQFSKATTSQKSVRAGGKHNDLENVGYTARHHTFFEMLGNFSFGDYFKEEAIYFAWDYLTRELKIDKSKLYFTVYHTDEEAYSYWKKLGVEESRIIKIATSDNFWSMGDTGPCGPCSEIFYDHGAHLSGGLPGQPDEGGERYVEIWNLVFMQFEQKAGGKMDPLPKPSIDTGMGLERFAAVMQGQYDNYQIDMFKNLISATSELIKVKPTDDILPSFKVIADHLRSTSFLIADGVIPSNEGRGYVLRRIMRRAMRHVNQLGSKDNIMHKLVPSLIREMGEAYPELIRAKDFITDTIYQEEERFSETLDRGMKILKEETHKLGSQKTLSGEVAFKLYDTYGFPLDLTCDVLRKDDIAVDTEGFEASMQKQKELARKSWLGSGENKTDTIWFDLKAEHGATEFLGYNSENSTGVILELIKDNNKLDSAKEGNSVLFITNQTPFYGESGGQVGDMGTAKTDTADLAIKDTKKFNDLHVHFADVISGEVKKGQTVQLHIDVEKRLKVRANHSATHLLHAALRKILGNHVTQKGSIVTDEKLRFDISHNKPITFYEIRLIEQEVNKLIRNNTEATTKLMKHSDAMESGAMALFGEKYGDDVRVVAMGDELDNAKRYSVELCGGTHVRRTGDIGLFKITSEGAIAAGVRRIEAVTGEDAIKYTHDKEQILIDASAQLRVPVNDFVTKVDSLLSGQKNLEKELFNLQRQILATSFESTTEIEGIEVAICRISNMNPKDLKSWVDNSLKSQNDKAVVILNESTDKSIVVVALGASLTSKLNAAEVAKHIVTKMGGSGSGGSANFAQGAVPTSKGLEEAVNEAISNNI
ncbi:MAG: alanine--tRNA ligase [Alphaproteobacteria bacterium]|nr:alanine--tRNA ligase [Alphaproteobacteria bacterium]OJV15810.1 MAG: alanine--tRNA ligase [Alphaproteobacteria bacterium 33-17]